MRMSDVSRREAFLTLAAGATGVTVAAASGAMAAPAPARASMMPPPHVSQAVAEAAQRLAREVERRPVMREGEAMVLQCRSWEGHVYLYISERVRGFVPVSGAGFAIATACQAAGRPVGVKHWGHDASWGDGVGRFEGALLAIDALDLPADSAQP
jgi:hypothetical protein